LTAADLASDNKINKKGVSVDTIKRLLNNSGLKYRRKRVTQDLTDDHKEERLRLARRYKRWNIERMNKILYSDESNICLQ
jgi:ethanolamine ammonia-lyase large subunit